MGRVLLRIPKNVYREIRSHLLRVGSAPEEAGFIFAHHKSVDHDDVFDFQEWYPVPADGFVVQSQAHFELTDDTRAAIIKRAHDLDASIVEFHSHGGPWPACFSPSDLLGLEEFVPHVWWRLRGTPYLAVVVTRKDFDGLVWLVAPESPQYLDGIEIQGSILKPTRRSPLRYSAYDL